MKQAEDPGGYVVCGHCSNVMVGGGITHCQSCRRGDMLTREDWGDKPFKRRERSR